MTTEAFQQNSLDWQFRLFSQRVGEWVEVRLANTQLPVPDLRVSPDWIVTLCWIILAAIALWLIWQLFNLLALQLRPVPAQRSQPSTTARSLSAAEWFRQAQQQQQQGNYREACRSLYLAMLQRLDEAQQIPIADSRTDGEYLQCVYQLSQPQPYQLLIQTHEQICFGSQPITIENFRSCQQAYEQIDRSLNPA
ncbi:DUF4129 domain-containing protein [Microcoleus sp. FACHB-1515]|uniref:DUF4129 domain-containing protein n=1 Tax=Cyanophyceae TaxID=3028117 RepID=UPI001681CA8F|nr:DUF4129 domain-containing protein [Microcoleus sp. FACHB-1515]MBD2091256.1 DUF4129 domain-containing protein [Microcoleus sp. FACHB-1515]